MTPRVDDEDDDGALAAFEALLDRHGAAAEAWPAADRERARRLLEREPRARALLAEAGRLDDLLRDALAAAPPARLQARLASIPAAEPGRRRRWPSLPARLAWGSGAAALAASAALGLVVLGTAEPPIPAAPEPDDAYVELASITFGPWLEPEDEP